MGLREDIRGVLGDIEKQVSALKALGASDAVVELGLVQSQLSCVLIEDEERATAARLDTEAHELYVKAKTLVRLAEVSERAVIERALGMIQAAAMDDVDDDDLGPDGAVLVRRGEDAAALVTLARMIARRSDPEAWWRMVQDDHDEGDIVIQDEESRDFLVRHFQGGK